MGTRLLSLWLAVILVGWPAPRAHADGQQIAQQATQLAGLGVMLATTDAIGSASACVSGNSPTPWADCSKLALNVVTVAGTVMSMMANKEAAAAQTGSGGAAGGATGDVPANPYADLLEPPAGVSPLTFENCKKSPASPACLDGLKKDLDNKLAEYKDGLNSGAIAPPAGSSVGDTLGALDAALDGSLDSQSLSPDSAFSEGEAKKVADRESVDSGMNFESGPGGGGGGGGYSKKDSQPKSPIQGKLVIKNGLERVDSATGQSLSLWQLASLRYLGKDNGRYTGLARIEFLRQRASKIAQQASARVQLPTIIPRGKKNALAPTSPVVPTRLPLN